MWPIRRGTPATTVAAFAALTLVGAAGAATDGPPQGEWVAGDLHVHTTYSHDSYGGPGDENTGPQPDHPPPGDAQELESFGETVFEVSTLGNTVAEQFAVAATRGLDFLAITDHNDVRSQGEFGAAHDLGVIPVPGYENSLSGHAQMLGATAVADNDIDGDGRADTADVERLASDLRAAGGVFQVNHPAEGSTDHAASDWTYGYDVQPDVVEVWNISRLWQPPLPSASSNDDAIRYWEGWLDRGARVGATGGSDNHYKATLAVQGPGQPTTWVYVTERSTQGVLDGLRAGRTFISHQPPALGGPELYLEADGDHDGTFEAIIGDTVPPGSAVRARVVGAPAAILRVIADGGTLVDEHTTSGSDVTIPLAIPDDATWVRAELVEPDGAEERRTACDGAFGDDTTYCRNQLAVLAMTSAIYLRPPAPAATVLVYTGDTVGQGELVELSADLTDADGVPVVGRTVTFSIAGTSYRDLTDADGTARTTATVPDHGREQAVEVTFAGDGTYAASQTTATVRWGRGG